MKRRILVIAACFGAVIFALHLFGLLVFFGEVPVSGAKRTGEVLSPVDLEPSERMEIEYTSVGCRSWCSWFFELSGGTEVRLVVVDAGSAQTVGPAPTAVGAISLAAKERRGLRDLLNYYRTLRSGDGESTTTNQIRVTYFRGQQKIGEEQFVDKSSVEFWVYAKDHGDAAAAAEGPNISADMVSFQTLFRRAWQEANPAVGPAGVIVP